MPTTKYGLLEIAYSATNWNSILTTDLQSIDAFLHTYVRGQAAETLAVGDVVYVNSDGKFAKAKAASGYYPAIGLVAVGGALDAYVLVQRVGPVDQTVSGGTVGQPVYLSTSSNTLTMTKPSTYIQPMGVKLSASQILLMGWPAIAGI